MKQEENRSMKSFVVWNSMTFSLDHFDEIIRSRERKESGYFISVDCWDGIEKKNVRDYVEICTHTFLYIFVSKREKNCSLLKKKKKKRKET